MKISVFTPTYNRAYTLSTLYNSLLVQTYRDFEWLIVDDGSTDNTEELIKSFTTENIIDICYLRSPNGGKHRAINLGVAKAQGELFFIVDSDDYLTPDALELVAQNYAIIEDNSRFAGVCGLRIFPDGRKVGGEQSFDVLDATPLEFRERHKIKGDMAEVFRTAVMREYPFPEFDGERFMNESTVWYRIAERYKLRYFYGKIYVCQYLPDGLTLSIRRTYRNSPQGAMLFYNELAQRKNATPLTRVKAVINYWRYTVTYKGRREKGLRPVAWSWLFYPAGWLFYLKDSHGLRSH